MADRDQRCEKSWVSGGELHECLFRHVEGYHQCDCGARLWPHDLAVRLFRVAAEGGETA